MAGYRGGVKLLFITLFELVIFSLTFAAATEECGIVNLEQFGNKLNIAQIDEFPWIAKLAYRKNGDMETFFPCHAVLISQQHLLTVAHCTSQKSAKPYAVQFGDWNSSNNFTAEDCDEVSGKCSTPLLIDIEKIIKHPMAEVKPNIVNDIALLRLTEKVTFSDYIRPICLPTAAKELDSKQLVVSGWIPQNPGTKKKTYVSISDQYHCRSNFEKKWQIKITDSHLCAEVCENGKRYLTAAPLMDVVDEESKPQKVYLAGLTSFGVFKCTVDLPDILTRVDRYLDWIKENLN